PALSRTPPHFPPRRSSELDHVSNAMTQIDSTGPISSSKFDRSEIMKAAHRYAQAYKGREWSYALLLSWGLKAAWKKAKDGKTPADRKSTRLNSSHVKISYA